jgi:hypothetical protein
VSRTNSSNPATVEYTTSDSSSLNNCDQVTGMASQRCDYIIEVGTIRFAAGEGTKTIEVPVIDDAYVEGSESFSFSISNPQGAGLGPRTTGTLTIIDNDSNPSAPNPVDGTDFFVREHYLDFLNREGEPGGFQGWRNILNNCPPSGRDSAGNHCDRIEVSSDFYRSEEFQTRGYFIYRFYSASLGRIPQYLEFMHDMSQVSGFQSASQLEASKVAFIADFIARPEFKNKYDSKTSREYVDELERTAGVTLTNKEQLIDDLEKGRKSRAEVLRAVIESQEVTVKFFNQAFVVMQYFGYLRRNPDILYLDWIETLNRTGDYRIMINGFINSREYRERFGKP